jgi:hypothetical protein
MQLQSILPCYSRNQNGNFGIFKSKTEPCSGQSFLARDLLPPQSVFELREYLTSKFLSRCLYILSSRMGQQECATVVALMLRSCPHGPAMTSQLPNSEPKFLKRSPPWLIAQATFQPIHSFISISLRSQLVRFSLIVCSYVIVDLCLGDRRPSLKPAFPIQHN